MQRRHRTSPRGSEYPLRNSEAIENLKMAFESAERVSPGISDSFLRDLFKTLLPNLNSSMLTEAQMNLLR